MKIFQREQRSLFGEILDWMLTPLLLLWPLSLALTWFVAQGIASKPFDRALEFNLQALTQFVANQNGQISFNLNSQARDLLRADDSDLVYYQVIDPRGKLVSGELDFPRPREDETPEAGRVLLRDDVVRGDEVRVAYTWLERNDAQHLVLMQVAETKGKRSTLATEIIKGVMVPQFIILPLAVLLVWLALVRGIRPLSALASRIRARKPDDLSPLDESAVPQEVGPLVGSVNDLLTRLKDSIATQKRFLADAAHQLKTPLAGLRMQADLAQREGASEDDLKHSLQQIGHASMRATHTVNQLLALARAEGGGAVLAHQPCDIVALTIEVVREAVPHALERRIDLGYEGPEPGAPEFTRSGNPTLLKEMLRNLVDNALNYTPSTAERPGVVTVRVHSDPFSQALAVEVEDNGPGVPAAERGRIFEPFYRALGTDVDGSGLGLPIVQEIAQQHGAQISVDDAHPGQHPPGACFTVRFAPRDPAPATQPAAL